MTCGAVDSPPRTGNNRCNERVSATVIAGSCVGQASSLSALDDRLEANPTTLDPAGSFGGEEGYRFNIADRIEIIAGTAVGSFYGTRTLLQLLRQNYTIGAGNARDWPDYNERGLIR